MNCSLCHSPHSTLIGTKGPSTYVTCDNCGLIRVDPLPTEEETNAMYAHYIYENRVSNPEGKILRYKLRVLPLWLMGKGHRFLDIGCNVGTVVEAARRLKCEAYGIDVGPGSIKIAKELWPDCHFYNESLEAFKARGYKFDRVLCSEVIEHVKDLHSFMEALVAVLNPGAVLFFTTPDTGHFRVPRKNILQWKELRPNEHVALFNKRNMQTLLEQYQIHPFFFIPMHRANMRLYARYLPQ